MSLWLVFQFLAAVPGLLALASDQRRWRDAAAPERRSLLRWRQVGTVWMVIGLPGAFLVAGSAASAMGKASLALMAQTGMAPEPTFSITATKVEQFIGSLSVLVPLGAVAILWSSWRLSAVTRRSTLVPDVDAMSVTGRVPRDNRRGAA
jgi:hypothetical protein